MVKNERLKIFKILEGVVFRLVFSIKSICTEQININSSCSEKLKIFYTGWYKIQTCPRTFYPKE